MNDQTQELPVNTSVEATVTDVAVDLPEGTVAVDENPEVPSEVELDEPSEDDDGVEPEGDDEEDDGTEGE